MKTNDCTLYKLSNDILYISGGYIVPKVLKYSIFVGFKNKITRNSQSGAQNSQPGCAGLWGEPCRSISLNRSYLEKELTCSRRHGNIDKPQVHFLHSH